MLTLIKSYTKTMPKIHIPWLLFIPLLILIVFLGAQATLGSAYEGLQHYYVRYDVKASKNRISTDNLLMVPAKNDFRTEKFSPVLISGAISAHLGEPTGEINQRIKEDCLKKLLTQQGLTSSSSKDLDTVISYEGVFISPLNILETTYHNGQNVYVYKAQIEFAPIKFPDNWESSGAKNRIKRMLHDFFQLFQ